MYEYRLDDMYAELIEMKRLVRQLLTQAPVGFTAVTRGALRVASNEGLLVEGSAKVDGWLIVTGTERVDGRLEGSGTLDWTGPWFLRGSGTILGNTVFDGDVGITNRLDVTAETRLRGETTIENDVVVTNDGKITAGKVTIDPSVGDGSVLFDNGGQVFSNADTVQVYKGNSAVTVADGHATMQWGGYAVMMDNNGLFISPSAIQSVSGTGLPEGALSILANGRLVKSNGL